MVLSDTCNLGVESLRSCSMHHPAWICHRARGIDQLSPRLSIAADSEIAIQGTPLSSVRELASGMRQLAGTKTRYRRAHAAPLAGITSGRAKYNQRCRCSSKNAVLVFGEHSVVKPAKQTRCSKILECLHAAENRMSGTLAGTVHIIEELPITICSRSTRGQTCVMCRTCRSEIRTVKSLRYQAITAESVARAAGAPRWTSTWTASAGRSDECSRSDKHR